jgi:hypothetical protein
MTPGERPAPQEDSDRRFYERATQKVFVNSIRVLEKGLNRMLRPGRGISSYLNHEWRVALQRLTFPESRRGISKSSQTIPHLSCLR